MQEDETDVQRRHLDNLVYRIDATIDDVMTPTDMINDLESAKRFIEDLLLCHRVFLPAMDINLDNKEVSFMFDNPPCMDYAEVNFSNGTRAGEARINGKEIKIDNCPPFTAGLEQKFFMLTTEIINAIRLPDPFDIKYDNVLPDVRFVWHDSYYDGPISGLCKHDGNLYYFVMVDQTAYTRDRMFAMYILPKSQMWRIRLSHKLFEFFVGYHCSYMDQTQRMRLSYMNQKPDFIRNLYWKISKLYKDPDFRDIIKGLTPIGHFHY